MGEIGAGLVLLVGFREGDDHQTLRWMAEKVVGLRVFADAENKMNLSLRDTGGEALIVSQFTLYGDTRKGRRPSFVEAASPEVAIPLYDGFIRLVREMGVKVASGEFGAMIQVELVNDGPVTLILERNGGRSDAEG